MAILTPGANAPITSSSFIVTLHHGEIPGADMDVSAFLLAASGKVRSDNDMCFYGQPEVEGGAVRLKDTEAGVTRFAVDLSGLPSSVEKIVFAATIHEQKASFAAHSWGEIRLEISGEATGAIPCTGMGETALILGEIYRRQGAWKVRLVGQGFNGGLAALAPHFGVVIGDAPASSETAPKPAAAPVSLKKVSLTKQGETSTISLKKGDGSIIRVTATWIDNGDARDDNDDLDLRAGILMPDGQMHWLAASHPGSLSQSPWARHMGDVQGASEDAPGTEIIEISPDIARQAGGPVGLVLSVYSAVSNGPVSIASLKPVMTVEHDGRVVECRYSFPTGEVAKAVYTYVIGTIDIGTAGIDVRLSGMTSPKGSENTPWVSRSPTGLSVTFDGSPVFKKGRTLMARMMGAGKKSYANV